MPWQNALATQNYHTAARIRDMFAYLCFSVSGWDIVWRFYISFVTDCYWREIYAPFTFVYNILLHCYWKKHFFFILYTCILCVALSLFYFCVYRLWQMDIAINLKHVWLLCISFVINCYWRYLKVVWLILSETNWCWNKHVWL